MKRILNKLLTIVDNQSIRNKLLFLYFACVLTPLLIADIFIIGTMVKQNHNKTVLQAGTVAQSVYFDLENMIEEVADRVNLLYINYEVNDFLETRFRTQSDYFKASYEFSNGIMKWLATRNTKMYFYTDNDTIVPGGYFLSLEDIKNAKWYKDFEQSGRNAQLVAYFAEGDKFNATARRKVTFVRQNNYFADSKYNKVICSDMDYNSVVQKITNMNYEMPIYICSGDRILCANNGHSSYTQDFDCLTGEEDILYEMEKNLYGLDLRILILGQKDEMFSGLKREIPFIIIVLAANIILPNFFVNLFNRSFVERLSELNDAFDMEDIESLNKIDVIRGSDEITNLMFSYNRMVDKSQELIDTVYKDKMERQEIDIARQNAELLALHSQINPHFLFNTLESIRMHSVLKGEKETADMIGKLAVLERQNVEWGNDSVLVSEEVVFIERYLELQKYRFGDRLSYEVEIAENCKCYYLPKLSLVTFVENACVHGMEHKVGMCRVYVSVYQRGDYLYLEIEDTGSGMEENKVMELVDKLKNCDITMLMESKSIGMINAYLRLKMVTNNEVDFVFESELDVGTYMLIKIPVNKLTKDEGDQKC